MRTNGRVPIIALDYSQRQKAVEKELMVDYATGNIYVVSATDKTVIFDITSQIAEQVNNLSEDMTISIDGLGDVNLADIVEQLYNGSLNVDIDDVGAEQIYVQKEAQIDGKSIEINIDNNIQIKGFKDAEEGLIPQKFDGAIRWITIPKLLDDEYGIGSTVDGELFPTLEINPVNSKLYLQAARRQKTIYPNGALEVILPGALVNEYTEVKWMVHVYDTTPVFTFLDNIVWESGANAQPTVGAYNVYTFETWDAGATWLGKVSKHPTP
jgi:hypothetical protein